MVLCSPAPLWMAAPGVKFDLCVGVPLSSERLSIFGGIGKRIGKNESTETGGVTRHHGTLLFMTCRISYEMTVSSATVFPGGPRSITLFRNSEAYRIKPNFHRLSKL